MSTIQNPTERLEGPELPIEGYYNIGIEAKLSESQACKMAHRTHDPLPCWKYLGKVLAWPSAIREWRARQIFPLQVAERLERIGGSD